MEAGGQRWHAVVVVTWLTALSGVTHAQEAADVEPSPGGETPANDDAVEAPVEAAERPLDELQPLVPLVHGFISQGVLKSTDNDYLARSERGSLAFSEVAINFNWQLTPRLRAAMQLFTRALGPFVANYIPRFDWFLLDWRWSDWLGLRAGRIPLPFGLYNATSDYGAGRTPILLPQAIYPLEARNILLAFTGVEAYGAVPLGALGLLEYRGYAGTSFIDPVLIQEDVDVEVPYTAGGQLVWSPPIPRLQLAGSIVAGRIEFDLVEDENGTSTDLRPILWLASLEYAFGDLLVATEYGRWRLRGEGVPVFAGSGGTSERFYASGFYGFTPWLNGGGYYALLLRNVNGGTGRENHQHDLAMALRLDLNDNWLLKLEAHYLHGTAYLDPRLNERPNDEAVKVWGLFLAQTMVHF